MIGRLGLTCGGSVRAFVVSVGCIGRVIARVGVRVRAGVRVKVR